MEEKLKFHNSKGDKLVGVLSNPGKTNEVVIFCHGRGSSKDKPSWLEFQKRFNETGLATFRFDFWGSGESDGKFDDLTVTELVDDILQAVKLAKSKGFQKISLIGSSLGGLASIIAASKLNDVKVLVLKSPVSDYKNKDRSESRPKKLLEDAKKYNAYKIALQIKIPTLIVHGDKDDVVPIKQSIKLANTITNSKLEILKGTDHNYKQPGDLEKLIKTVFGFTSKYLNEEQ